MKDALIALWHKLHDALKHIEEELGFSPGSDAPEDGGVSTNDTGNNGPPPQ